MRTRVRLIIFIIVAYLLGVTLLVGCVKGEMGSGDELPDRLTGVEETQVAEEETEDPGFPVPDDAHHGNEVLMMGRSVLNGWFDHWGYDWTEPVSRDGYLLYYREIASPPDIGSDAAAAIATVPDGTTVFYKQCFVDFWASEEYDVQTNTDECVGYLNEVRAAAQGRDITVIVGNALPQTLASTNVSLVKTHRAYNDALDQLAAEDDHLVVFDQYSLLADQNGALYKGLAVSVDDAHLNNVAYEVLDEEFFSLLDSLE